jgi:hypothetical protein
MLYPVELQVHIKIVGFQGESVNERRLKTLGNVFLVVKGRLLFNLLRLFCFLHVQYGAKAFLRIRLFACIGIRGNTLLDPP